MFCIRINSVEKMLNVSHQVKYSNWLWMSIHSKNKFNIAKWKRMWKFIRLFNTPKIEFQIINSNKNEWSTIIDDICNQISTSFPSRKIGATDEKEKREKKKNSRRKMHVLAKSEHITVKERNKNHHLIRRKDSQSWRSWMRSLFSMLQYIRNTH